MLQYY